MTDVTTEMLFSQPHPLTGGRPLYTANSLFAQARKRARRGQFWSSLTGRSRGLFALKQVRAFCTIEAESDGGIRTVPLSQIRGSEGRSRYFDCDFNPLHDRARGRWLNIATARRQGLPPSPRRGHAQPTPPVVILERVKVTVHGAICPVGQGLACRQRVTAIHRQVGAQ